jgi:hypothetical protein
MIIFLIQLGTALFWILYGSFFEWYWHCCWMHRPRFPREAFHRHTLVHHTRYKGDESFYVQETGHPDHVLLKPYALPAILAAHLPIAWLVDRFFIHHTLWVALGTMLIYFVAYEYVHWNIHVPRGHFVERFQWFQFLRTHHKLHHRYHRWNFCVLFPLADLMMGTLLTEAMLARRSAKKVASKLEEAKSPSTKRRRRRSSTLAQDSMMAALPRQGRRLSLRARRERFLVQNRWLLRWAYFNDQRKVRRQAKEHYSLADLKDFLTLHRQRGDR